MLELYCQIKTDVMSRTINKDKQEDEKNSSLFYKENQIAFCADILKLKPNNELQIRSLVTLF